MKKQLLSAFAALTAITVSGQTPSPSWTLSQNASFTVTQAGHRYMDAVDNNVVWLGGYDGIDATANHNWFSRTTNGGNLFTSGEIFPGDTSTYALGNIEGIDANTAWCSVFQRTAPYSIANPGGGGVFKTTNGGATWVNMNGPGMFTNTAQSFCNWVTFVDPNTGVANGDPVGTGNGEFEIWRTTNAGASWTQIPGSSIPNPLTGEFAIINLYCKEGNNIWFGTNAARVYRSNDAGLTWSVSALPGVSSGTVTELAFSSANNGVVLAATGTTLSMYNTTDGGATWNLIHTNLTDPNAAALNIGRNDLCNIPGTGFLASVDNLNGTLSYSKNNGVTWIDWGSVGIGYVCIDFANSYRGWVGGFSDAGNPFVGGIFKFNGLDFNSSFTIPTFICSTGGNVTVTPVNNSNGLPPTTFSWSAAPAGVLFSSLTASTPVITFTANGSYTVTLEVNNPDGTAMSSQVIDILNCTAPVSQFSLSANSICNNTAITLTNTSTGAPNPTVVVSTNPSANVTITPMTASTYTLKFNDPGTYVVSMTATNNTGSSTYTESIVITECRPSPSFTIESTVCKVQDTVFTNNTSTGVITSSTWSMSPNGAVLVPVGTGTLTNRRIHWLNGVPGNTTFTLVLRTTNSFGTTSYSQTILVTADNCVGIAENELASNLSIYPNPAREQVNIALPSSYTSFNVKLTNVLGSVIYSEKVTNNKEKVAVSLYNQPKGIYFLTVEADHEKVTRKIVVE